MTGPARTGYTITTYHVCAVCSSKGEILLYIKFKYAE